MSRRKKIIAASLVTGAIVVGTSSGSYAALPKPLKNVFDATIGRVASTFTSISNKYIGGLIDAYLPKGFETVIGALGLPDPGGVFDEIRAKIAAGDKEDVDSRLADSSLTAWGGIQMGIASAEITQKLGEGFFNEQTQLANSEGDKAVEKSVETAHLSNQRIQGLDVTQNILKEMANQNESLVAMQAAIAQRLSQQNQQAAGANFSLGHISKSLVEENQEKATKLSNKSKGAAGQASFTSGYLEKK